MSDDEQDITPEDIHASMADEVHQPTGSNEEQEDAAPLDLQDALDERDADDILDEGYSPPEKPLGVTKTGVTAAEQHEGESLDERLRQEVPDTTQPAPDEAVAERGEPGEPGERGESGGEPVGDLPGGEGEPVDPEAGAERAGRLVAPDEGVREVTTKEEVAADRGVDGGAAGAEEAAVHVTPSPRDT
ncbi:DUF5709 domain-containing protein [Streptomyces indicus]|uniref:DUF5709 domain-containing protein n=1 Tax=Streptomyces indicus TaxID=417292 RepID=A0A1G9J0U0_9ACTN|nr:DUF5709 domain-containing protein [Streptomyces indicus]SDL30823.1 hypothetical protein SAMN05421806_12644 [Streptomyces indicus]